MYDDDGKWVSSPIINMDPTRAEAVTDIMCSVLAMGRCLIEAGVLDQDKYDKYKARLISELDQIAAAREDCKEIMADPDA